MKKYSELTIDKEGQFDQGLGSKGYNWLSIDKMFDHIVRHKDNKIDQLSSKVLLQDSYLLDI